MLSTEQKDSPEMANPHIRVIAQINNLAREHRVIVEDKLVNPLDDLAFCELAKECEAHGGEHPYFKINLKRVIIDQHCKMDDRDSRGTESAPMCRYRFRNSSEMDAEYLMRTRRKYGKDFPKTFEKIRDQNTVKLVGV